MKRIFKIFVCAILFVFMMPISAYATEGETLEEPTVYTSGDYEYTLNENNEAIITMYNGSATTLDIPSTIDGYTVVEIGEKAFSYKKLLEKVSIPDTVKTIGDFAFERCDNIIEVKLSKNLQCLGKASFYDCDSLCEIMIPKSLEESNCPFQECDSLTTVYFENDIMKVVPYLFTMCPGLEEIQIPETVVEIGEQAFSGCDNLKTIILPNNLKVIGVEAFYSSKALTEISIPDSVTEIGDGVFEGCQSLKTVKLSNNFDSIVPRMFMFCDSLKKIELPSNVKTIEYNAFMYSGLEEIELSENLETIGSQAFLECHALTTISLPDSMKEIGAMAFEDCDNLINIDLGNGLTGFGSCCFRGCAALESIILPRQINMLFPGVFTECTNLTEIICPSVNNTYIWSGAFSEPEKMTVYGVPGSYVEEWANTDGATFVPYEKEATGINIITSSLILDKGEESRVVYAVTPIDSTDGIEWSSSNENVATVSEYGTVTATGGGTATITAKVGDLTATCEVTVIQEDTPVYVEIEGSTDENTSFEIYDANGNKVTSTNITGSGSKLADLPEGTYTLKVSKENYVSRTYTIEVGTEEIQLNVELHKTGDITGDNTINARDKKMLYNHIAGTAILEDYDFAVGDVTGDGTLNARDKKMIYNHIAGTSSLWE